MTEILTVTLNPCVDISTATDTVVPGPKLRCDLPRLDPGGGGLNVSRAIAQLGGRSTAFMAAGGPSGAQLVALLRAEGLEPDVFDLPGDTRQSIAVTDRATGGQYRFVLPGPAWTAPLTGAVLQHIADAAPRGGYLVLSGSQPPGVPDDFPLQLARRTDEAGARLILDISGPPVRHLLEAAQPDRPVAHILRMDQAEAEALARQPLPRAGDTADFAAALVARGVAAIVIVARGADGSVLTGAGHRLHAMTEPVPVKSKIGAGDSFVAGLTLALAQGRDLPAALALATSAASAAVMTDATLLCRRADVDRLLGGCRVTPL